MKKIVFCLLGFALIAGSFVHAQQKGIIKALVKDKQTIRDISKEYLNDPDLWEEILRSNNLKSPADVKPGMSLTIPYNQIMRAKSAADDAWTDIQKANVAGAKSFATESIDKAASLHSQSLKERKNGNWERSYQLASQARQEAVNAYQESVMKSSAKGEASVTFAKGKVESKKSAESLWRTIALLSKLIENDKVRTLSESYAEISFIDKSKIRLSENSQAVIQRNRVDLLKNTSEAKVSLEKGDAFALLTGGQGKRKLNLEVPGLETTVRSKAYWVNRDEKATKVANYDGEIELKSKVAKVTLKSNQGSSMLAGGKLTEPKDLLKAPVLKGPAQEFVAYSDKMFMEWEAVPQAASYWLIIAKDASFKSVLTQIKKISGTSKEVTLERGVYFWKVAAVDKDGFPGPYSEGRSYTMIVDNDAPYMAVSEPMEDAVVNTDSVVILGTTEAKAKIYLNGKELAIGADARFSATVGLKPGMNEITLEAIDLSKNKTTIKRHVRFDVGSAAFIRFDLSDYAVKNNAVFIPTTSMTLHGQTVPNSTLLADIAPKHLKLRATADQEGKFRITINGITGRVVASVQSVTPEHKLAADSVVIIKDEQPANMIFTDELPYNTNDADLVISGFVKNCHAIQLENQNVTLSQDKFQAVVKLQEGKNLLVFKLENNNGIITRVQREVILDTRAPDLISARILPTSAKVTSTLQFEVKAKDESGLKKTTKVVYQAGDDYITIYLKLDEVTNTYRGTAYINLVPQTDIKIKSVLLEDQLGNTKEYNLSDK
ncbi:MAG: FecR family protein [Ignavibacteria bacterium]|nr:FecR family protein [Ignavibacteria bacterium]